LRKINPLGDVIWAKNYPNANWVDGVKHVIQTSDGGYILLRQSNQYTPEMINSASLIKTNESGDITWEKDWDGTASLWYHPSSALQTVDGGYIVTGLLYHQAPAGIDHMDAWLVKKDDLGNIVWTKTIQGNTNTWYSYGSIQYTNNGDFIIAGAITETNWSRDIWLVKTNPSGDTLWTKILGTSGKDESVGVLVTSDGGYFLSGQTNSYGAGSYDIWLIKTDALGIMQWNKTYGTSFMETGCVTARTVDGGFILAGQTDLLSNGWDWAIWILRIDSSGDTLWTTTYDTGGNDGGCILQAPDEGYLLLATEGSVERLIKYAPEGTGLSQKNLLYIPKGYNLSQNYPNPFNPITTIEFTLPKTSEVSLKIFNILGEEVATLVSDRLSTGSYSYEWDASNHASGVYLYRLQAGDYVETKKMILMR
jgi:hypothetical protein